MARRSAADDVQLLVVIRADLPPRPRQITRIIDPCDFVRMSKNRTSSTTSPAAPLSTSSHFKLRIPRTTT